MALYVALSEHSPRILINASQTQANMLSKYFRRKKINVFETTSIAEFEALSSEDPTPVLLLCTDQSYNDWVRASNRMNIPVIALTFPNALPGLTYCSADLDPQAVMVQISQYMLQNGKTHIAFVGINTGSEVDFRKASTLYTIHPTMQISDFFINTGSIDACLDAFLAVRDRYDGIIVTNDCASLLLLQKLKKIDPDYLNGRFLVSFANTVLSRLSAPSITSVTYSDAALRHAVLTTYRMLAKYPGDFVSLTTTLGSQFFPRDTTDNRPLPTISRDLLYANYTPRNFRLPVGMRTPPRYTYDNDPDVNRIVRLDALLDSLDLIDFQIILAFLDNVKNEEVCNRLHISMKTIQYRTKQMFQALLVEKKKEFIAFVSQYIDRDALRAYLRVLEEREAADSEEGE